MGKKSKEKTTSSIPGYAQPLAMGAAKFAQNFDQPFLKPSMKLAQGTVEGEYLDINKNPYLQQRLGSLMGASQRRGDIQRGASDLYFGRLGPEFSVDAARAGAELERDISGQTLGQISEFLGQQYGQERGLQQQAIGMLPALGYMPLEQATSLLRALSGTNQTSTQPTDWGQTVNALIQAGGQVAGAYAGGG
jgi:hypothetical protein